MKTLKLTLFTIALVGYLFAANKLMTDIAQSEAVLVKVLSK